MFFLDALLFKSIPLGSQEWLHLVKSSHSAWGCWMRSWLYLYMIILGCRRLPWLSLPVWEVVCGAHRKFVFDFISFCKLLNDFAQILHLVVLLIVLLQVLSSFIFQFLIWGKVAFVSESVSMWIRWGKFGESARQGKTWRMVGLGRHGFCLAWRSQEYRYNVLLVLYNSCLKRTWQTQGLWKIKLGFSAELCEASKCSGYLASEELWYQCWKCTANAWTLK